MNPPIKKCFYINKFSSKYPYTYQGLYLLKVEEFKSGIESLQTLT